MALYLCQLRVSISQGRLPLSGDAALPQLVEHQERSRVSLETFESTLLDTSSSKCCREILVLMLTSLHRVAPARFPATHADHVWYCATVQF